MRIFYLISIILFLKNSILYSQEEKLFPFKIEGSINADTGIVELNILSEAYYPKGVKKIEAKVENGRFLFTGYFPPYPQGVRLTYQNGRSSDLFVIEPGKQSVLFNMNAHRETPKVDNQSMKEYYQEYSNAFKHIWQKRDLLNMKWDSLALIYKNKIPDNIKLKLDQERKESYIESDSTLLEYVTTHPDSYIAFWKFIRLSSGFGYENIFDSILEKLSDSLKSTYAGKALAKNLKIAGLLAIDKKFPPFLALDKLNNKLDVALFLNNKYTLIDFWYSNCYPCRAQFPHLKDTYNEYKNKGFEIIGISTDKVRYKKMWLKAIEEHNLLWPQYWDKEGIESFKLSINAFPTNFLLDSEGKIIRKNIAPSELEEFLSKKLN
ncbi:MAG TPA: TlpA disulfide reductase family protein [Cytophagales bacterium]|nr:TlpA disulfide reductase family protein [Cytophagales bacterium]